MDILSPLTTAHLPGIGTTNPSRLLDVNGNMLVTNRSPGYNIPSLLITRDLGTNDVSASQHGYQLEIGKQSDSKRLAVGVNDSGLCVLQGKEIGVGYLNIGLNPIAGNVGIGTTNPQAKLHVNGDLKVGRLGTGFNSVSLSLNTQYNGPAHIVGNIYNSSKTGHCGVKLQYGNSTNNNTITNTILLYRIYDSSPYQIFPLVSYIPAGYWCKVLYDGNADTISFINVGGEVINFF